MDRYIECKTQEQWNTVLEHLNKKYGATFGSGRLNYENKWLEYKENSIVEDNNTMYWMQCNKKYYLKEGITHFISFEEFCKQEGINMKKKSTDYCFILKETDDYPVYSKKYGYDLRGNCPGLYYYPTNEDNLIWYAESTKPDTKQVITWQEFKQLFIDKTMTTQEEINELKTRLQELEEKYKKGNEFKAGDWVYAEKISPSQDWRNDAYIPTFQIEEISNNGYIRPEKDKGTGIHVSLCRKATQAEIADCLAKNKPIEISGYKAEFNRANKTVSFGCKKDITKKDLEAILTVMKLNEKFNHRFCFSDKVIYQDKENGQDFSEMISKETIQKLIDKLEE